MVYSRIRIQIYKNNEQISYFNTKSELNKDFFKINYNKL